MQAFKNVDGRQFQEWDDPASEVLRRELVGRGLAVGDLNNDGSEDLVVTDLEGPALIIMNHAGGGRHWIALKLEGTASNRMGLGSRVSVTTGGRTQVRECQTGGSFLSASDARVHFGLAGATEADTVTVRWPSGRTSVMKSVKADRVHTVKEPS
jgi:hypothetical protein